MAFLSSDSRGSIALEFSVGVDVYMSVPFTRSFTDDLVEALVECGDITFFYRKTASFLVTSKSGKELRTLFQGIANVDPPCGSDRTLTDPVTYSDKHRGDAVVFRESRRPLKDVAYDGFAIYCVGDRPSDVELRGARVLKV